MTTTLVKFADATRGNYSTLPTIDVEIISPEPLCGARHRIDGESVACFKPIVDTGVKQHGMFPVYAHADGTNAGEYVCRSTQCGYCGTNDPELVRYRQHPWHDAVECDRCGGVTGRAIGD